MRTIITALVAALLCVASLLVASPASAGSCTGPACGTVIVPSDPPGAGRGVIITCNWSYPNSYDHVVNPGQSSKAYCADADGIYVATGREVLCSTQTSGWVVTFDATGWHKITDLFYRICYDRAD